MSTTKILLIVGLVCLVPVLGLAGLFVLGSVAEKQLGGELVADELPWAAHEDPGGWYVLDMPGNVSVDTIEMPGGFGSASVSVETALVSDRDFGATVTRAPAAVPEGQTFVAEAYSVDGAERALSDAGAIDDAEVVAHDVVPGTDDLQMFLEVRGTVEGEPAVLWSRLVIAGADLYELNAVGLLEDRDEIEAILDRMVSSFTPT